MPLSGGATDKLGNRYELWWTVLCMAHMLNEDANAISFEPPGVDGDGVEFILTCGNVKEHHQVKRQHTQRGKWSFAALEQEHVLSRFWTKLNASSDNQCHFVSIFAADELHELPDNARSADDFALFKQEFLAKSASRTNGFAQITRYWSNCSEEEAYYGLRRIFVRTIDEQSLRVHVEYMLKTLVSSDASTTAAMLAQYALDHIHNTVFQDELWQFLESKGVSRRLWNNDPHILALIANQNERYLRPHRHDALAGITIPRHELNDIVTALEAQDGKQGVLVSGEAGVGKSGVGLQIVDYMQGHNWPVLAFRIDQFDTMQSPQDVGRQLELPESPVTILANIAQRRPCLLVIDQLDAISKVSGRHIHFFDCIAEIIGQAKIHPSMRVVLLCRKFDIVNDDRLRKLTGEQGFAHEITIGHLDHNTVRDITRQLGLAADSLTLNQLNLLSIPLHLKLLAEVADSNKIHSLDFVTANDLFKTFWDHKRQILTNRLGRPVTWAPIIDKLCENMNQTRRLFAPYTLLDEYESDAEAMTSEHVLVRDGVQYRFFHEAFFDYAFARRFVSNGNPLLSLLLAEEQHLFRRAQVRQIMAYCREDDFDRYLSDLTEVLGSSNVRFHIKQVIFALLRQVASPTRQEWKVLAPMMENSSHPLYGEVWHLSCQLPWFRALKQWGVIEKLLAADELRINQTIRLIGIIAREAPDDVVDLIEGRDIAHEAWRQRLLHILSWADLSKSRSLFDLFLKFLQQGVLDGISAYMSDAGDFWLMIYSLSEKKPEWYCEVVKIYLNHHLEVNFDQGRSDPFAFPGTIDETDFIHPFTIVAQQFPALFIAAVFDFVLQVAERNAMRELTPPYRDTIWRSISYGQAHSIKDSLLKELENALRLISLSAPEEFASYAERLQSSETKTAQFLLIRAYSANGQRFADEAATYLCENSKRFQTGWVDESHWATRLLLEAITPYCSQHILDRLTTALMNYYPDWERSAASYRKGHGTARGYSQLVLLNGIVLERRSLSVRLKLSEWSLKFDEKDGKPPTGVTVRHVESPLSDKICQRMTDTQWLRAIAKYDSDRTHWGTDQAIGGAYELARKLEACTRLDPDRFANLLLCFPSDTHTAYFDAVLRGLEENDKVETALKICRFCQSLPDLISGHWISYPLKNLQEQKIPEELLDILVWYATEAKDPTIDEMPPLAKHSEAVHLIVRGTDSVRGAAILAIADLIFDVPSRTAYFLPHVNRLLLAPSLSIRACAASILIAMLNVDRDLAVQMFLRLVEEGDDRILATEYVDRFLYYALHTHFEQLQHVIERMLTSPQPEIAEVGAMRVCLIALSDEEALPLAQRCITGTSAHRKGAATIFAHNIVNASNRLLVEEALIAFFQDEDAEVRKTASHCFQYFMEDTLGDFTRLVEAFVSSPAIADKSFTLIRALEKTTAKLPEITCLVCERFLEVVGNEMRDMRTSAAGEASTISKLVVRIYEQNNNASIQSRCLDMIDQMARQAIQGLHDALMLLDR